MNIRPLEIIGAVLLVVGVPLCYGFLFFNGVAFIGAGHGSDYFASLALSPFYAGNSIVYALVFWPIFAFMLAFRSIEFCRRAAWGLLFLHFAGVVWLSFTTEWGYVMRVLDHLDGDVTLYLSIYLGSQILFWFLLKRAAKKSTPQVAVP